MAKWLNKRVKAGAYKWMGKKYYWIEDTKTGEHYKGYNQHSFDKVVELIDKSHDMNRLMAKINNYSFEGKKGFVVNMGKSYQTLLKRKYGASSSQLEEFERLYEQMAQQTQDALLWRKFVDKNNEWFSEYWDKYKAGDFMNIPDNPEIPNSTVAGVNAQIDEENSAVMQTIIEAMSKTLKTGKVVTITKEFKDYNQFMFNSGE